ncbi:hypothetical protein RsTz2092_14020 [Deferribacterales bacterium RsTz2092]
MDVIKILDVAVKITIALITIVETIGILFFGYLKIAFILLFLGVHLPLPFL